MDAVMIIFKMEESDIFKREFSFISIFENINYFEVYYFYTNAKLTLKEY